MLKIRNILNILVILLTLALVGCGVEAAQPMPTDSGPYIIGVTNVDAALAQLPPDSVRLVIRPIRAIAVDW